MFCVVSAFGQQKFVVDGYVYDKENQKPLIDVVIKLSNKLYTTSDGKGFFKLEAVPQGTYTLEVILLGYKTQQQRFTLKANHSIRLELVPQVTSLSEVVVAHKSKKRMVEKVGVVTTKVSAEFLLENQDNSLMQSLDKVAGVSSITIGSGQSKPVIRGLGFNRVAVVQNGIKHEAQQWGVDHGLEIDQFGIEEVEIVKGPISLLYGSDAIAGVVDIKPPKVPTEKLSGNVQLLGQTNNDLLGISAGVASRKGKWFYGGRITYKDYADYKVPANTIRYDNYVFELHQGNLRNTAGREADISARFGFIADRWKSETYVSNVYGKNGFFANAHGAEVRISNIDYDADNRDIDLPYHKLNHFKISNTSHFWTGKHHFKLDLGFQNNLREEYAEPAAHGFMPKPEETKERRFDKNTFTLNLTDSFSFDKHQLVLGANAEYQQNHIGGWGFLIPAYQRFTAGIFGFNSYQWKPKWRLQAGLRYDFGLVATERYDDWFRSEIENNDGTTSRIYRRRAKDQSIDFHSYSGSVGLHFDSETWHAKLHLGKSFRIPLANELSSDGVNYHMYRYERGNDALDAESAYQLDAELSYQKNNLEIVLSPFVNYFDNFIYLNPTPFYFETLQIYEYTQAEVLRYGGELHIHWQPLEKIELESNIEYVYSKQTTGPKKNFGLPFSPPLSLWNTLKYQLGDWSFLKQNSLQVDWKIAANQERIVPPEENTEGYQVLDFSWITQLRILGTKEPAQLRFKVHNALDTKYFNHTSFYRLIDVPEAGRNYSVSLNIPF